MGKRKSAARLTETQRGPAAIISTMDGPRRSNVWFAILPCIAAILIFLPTLHFGFVGDDHAQIERNPQLQSWSYLPRLLTTEMWSQRGDDHVGFFYRPFFSCWLLLVYSLLGAAPWLWHLASILLHSVTTLLVFLLLNKIVDRSLAASVGTTFFAIHPIHVETVGWISASNETLYTICVLGSLLVFCGRNRASDAPEGKIWRAVIFWSAALLFKETAIATLPVFMFLIWTRLETPGGLTQRLIHTLKRTAPFAVVGTVYLAIRIIVLHRSGLEIGKHPWIEVLLSAPGLFVFYLKKLILPWNLSTFYFEDLSAGLAVRVWLALAVTLIVGAALIWLAIARRCAVTVGGALIVLPLIPVLGGLRIYEHGNIAHDRYLYLPSVGLCILVALLVNTFLRAGLRWRLIAGGLGLLTGAAMAYLSVTQQPVYANDQSYFQRGVESHPRNFLVWELWGRFDLVHSNPRKGLDEETRAFQIAPQDLNVQYYYARALFENERYAEAKLLLTGLSARSDLKESRRKVVLLALAHAQIKMHQYDDADKSLTRLAAIDQQYPGLHHTRGKLFELRGRFNEAQDEYSKEAALDSKSRQDSKN